MNRKGSRGRLTRKVVLFCAVVLPAGACHRTVLDGPDMTGPPPRPATTRLARDGCAAELPGSWTMAEEASEQHWSAERSDAEETLTVMPMTWKATSLESEWREDLGAVINLRRDEEAQTAAAGTLLSEPEFVSDASTPSAFYTSFAPQEQRGVIMIAKATSELLCVYYLSGSFSTQAEIGERAEGTIAGLEVGAQ